jgi:hypothetical protein
MSNESEIRRLQAAGDEVFGKDQAGVMNFNGTYQIAVTGPPRRVFYLPAGTLGSVADIGKLLKSELIVNALCRSTQPIGASLATDEVVAAVATLYGVRVTDSEVSTALASASERVRKSENGRWTARRAERHE